MVALLCWAAVVLDGFDLVVLGALIPTMTDPAAPWMTTAQATAISTASLIGMTLGALSIGWATDRIGRRKAMLWAVGFFSVMTLGCAIAGTPFQLGVFRFLAGFGLGGCLPTAIALVTEFSRGKAGKASTTVMTGYHVGAVATAILGLILLAPFGWRAMFLAGAIPGFVLIPLMIKLLPESPAFLLSQGRRAEAERIASAYGLTLSEPPPKAERVSPSKLIGPGFLRNSVAIWVTSFMGLLLVYGLNTWLPALMVAADYGLQRGLWFLLLLNVGAIVGLIVAGRVGDAIGLKRAACLWFFAGAVLLALLAIRMPLSLLYPVVFLTGCFVFSAQVLVYAFTAANHPPEVRATAIGLSAGVGRIGAIMGPLVGGMLVSLGLGHPWGFFIFAAVGLIGALALSLSVVRVYR
ncbi:MFS transporter [Haematobacter missouriensis]|uniref:MFS transporter n=2 Tax=Haematobacter missouriensis TaxID=366616 RepID=A0A212ANF5_9RHOB|nr:MFS transporter [Haematobacter missouriensis]OWJ83031.1 MFS transporter [Haematobacter missouriensis]